MLHSSVSTPGHYSSVTEIFIFFTPELKNESTNRGHGYVFARGRCNVGAARGGGALRGHPGAHVRRRGGGYRMWPYSEEGAVSVSIALSNNSCCRECAPHTIDLGEIRIGIMLPPTTRQAIALCIHYCVLH